MCDTCGCLKPENKHGEKTIAQANHKYSYVVKPTPPSITKSKKQ